MLLGGIVARLLLSWVVLGACIAAPSEGALATETAPLPGQYATAEEPECGRVRGRELGKPQATTRVTQLSLGNGWSAVGAVYPHPQYEGRPWSQWGEGKVVAGSSSISAIGDHRGVDGNSFIYRFDAGSGQLALMADAAKVLGHRPGNYGFGKMHAQAVGGPCGEIYLATYWGSQRTASEDPSYRGDHLLRLDLGRGTIEDLGIPIPRHGIPSLASSSERGLLFGEAVDVTSVDEKTGVFFVYDVRTRRVLHRDATLPHVGFRSILVDARGHAYYAAGDKRLNRYDADRSVVAPFAAQVPGEWLRAVTHPSADGVVYGVTREPDALFALSRDGKITSLGSLPGYVASIALDARRERLLFIPDAHGGAWKKGTPLMAFDLKTQTVRTLVKLGPTIEREFKLRAGGSYNIVIDRSGERAFIGLNAGPLSSDASFGEVLLVVIELK